MKLLVDADACPVKQLIVREAKRRALEVIMLADTSHEIEDGYSRVVTVDKGPDSADFRLANLIAPGDVVITQDYGVAALALGKSAFALNQNGLIYNDQNIDRLLFERALGQKVRRAGGRTGKCSKRTRLDDSAFETALKQILNGADVPKNR